MKKITIFLTIVLWITSSIKAENTKLSSSKNDFQLNSPIGDNLHVEVYSFIKDALLTAKRWSKSEIVELRKIEIKHQNDSEYKLHIAEMYEGEVSGLLRILCKNQPSCYAITIYQKDGVGISTSGIGKNLKLKNKRPIDYNIGILGDELQKKLTTFQYRDYNNILYFEFLTPIYMDKKYSYAYLSLQKKEPKDFLIGYVGYLTK